MGHDSDEFAKRAKNVVRIRPGDVIPTEITLPDGEDESVAEDASAPDVLDRQAEYRDAAAQARDLAAANRAAALLELQDPRTGELDRLHAARDRAAAALDRQEAALDRHRAAAYLKRTYRDALTGALQREAGRDQLASEVDRAHRSGDPLLVAFLDVVHLKHINDELGHATGDKALKTVGEALRDGLRSYDIVVRYGGDEFVCGLPMTNADDARRRFDEVTTVLTCGSPPLAISIGLAELQADVTLDDVIGRADRDLYEGREKSGHSITTAAPETVPPAATP